MKSKYINFRQAADEAMQDINVTQELKERVLARSTNKRRAPVFRLAAMAACTVLIFGILNFSGVLRRGYQPDNQNVQGTHGILEADNTQDALSAPEAGIFSATIEQSGMQAGQSFGGAFLTPTYIPEGFQQEKILATGSDPLIADKIILSYIAEERTFVIIEEKIPEADNFLDDGANDIDDAADIGETVVINGTEGYQKADPSGSQVHWFKDGVYYSVFGQITVEEAVKVARSMRPID